MENTPSPKRIERLQLLKCLLFVILVYASFHGLTFLLEERCSIITCEPASWNTIQEIAIEHTSSGGNNYKLDEIPLHIRASVDNSLNKNNLLDNVEISIYYVSTRPSSIHGKTTYPAYVIRFDDTNLWIKGHRRPSISTPSLPTEDVLNRFKRVHLGYNDIFNMTWDKANETLIHPIHSVFFGLSLTDKVLQDFGVESVWYVRYSGENDMVEYWVDARSGKVVRQIITK